MYNLLMISVVAFIFSFTTASCTSDPKNKYVGKWQLVEIGESDVHGTNYVTKKRFRLDSNYSMQIFENGKALVSVLPGILNQYYHCEDSVSWEIDMENESFVFHNMENLFTGDFNSDLILALSPNISPTTRIIESSDNVRDVFGWEGDDDTYSEIKPGEVDDNNDVDENAIIIELISPIRVGPLESVDVEFYEVIGNNDSQGPARVERVEHYKYQKVDS